MAGKRTVSFMEDDRIVAFLDEEARRLGLSRSELIRRIVFEYVKNRLLEEE